MKQILLILAALCFCISTGAQEIEVTGSRKAVRTSGDVGAVLASRSRPDCYSDQ